MTRAEAERRGWRIGRVADVGYGRRRPALVDPALPAAWDPDRPEAWELIEDDVDGAGAGVQSAPEGDR